jgi:uncharacterized protein YbbC (DUF1343 family)
VSFTPHRPGDGKYADTLVSGIRLELTDEKVYDPTRTAVHLLSIVRAVHGDRLDWMPAHFDRLAGSSTLRRALTLGTAPDRIVDGWRPERETFIQRRQPFLLYPE